MPVKARHRSDLPSAQLSTLGELALHNSHGAVTPLPRRALVLLAYVSRARAPIPRAMLATLLWGDRPDARARHSLRQTLLQLRQCLGDALQMDADRISLAEQAVITDVERFETELRAGRTAQALALWQGEFLAGTDDIESDSLQVWVSAERARLGQLLLAAAARWVDDAHATGASEAAVERTLQWVQLQPEHPAPHRALIHALQRCSRYDEAGAHLSGLIARARVEEDERQLEEWQALASSIPREAPTTDREPLVAGAVALFTPLFVGRAAPYARLRALLEDGPHDAGAVALITGDDGVGKTRLVAEVLSSHARDMTVLHACAAGTLAYAALREALRALPSVVGLSGVPDWALAELSRLVPSLRERWPHLPAFSTEDGAAAEALVRTLADVACEKPVVVWVDDIDALDAASRDILLAAALRRPPNVVWLICGPHTLDLADAVHIRLAPLGAEDVAAMIASMAPFEDADRADIAREVQAACGGNPLLVVQTLAALAEANLIRIDERGCWVMSDGALESMPRTLHDVLTRRLQELSAEAKQLLAVAAATDLFTADELASLAGIDRDNALRILDELVRRRFIEQQPGAAGSFRWASAPVRRMSAAILPPAAGRGRSRRRRRIQVAVAALVLVVATSAGWLLYRSQEVPEASVGVLPFVQVGVGDTAFFAEGLTDEVINTLSRAPGLRVAARSSSYALRETKLAFPELGRRLGARYLVEGSVRRDGERLRIAVQLIDAATGYQRWSDNFESDANDMFAAQATVAQAVMAELGSQVRTGSASAPPNVLPTSRETYLAYLRGRYYWNRRRAETLKLAVASYEEAIRRDSLFSPAWSALAGVYVLQPWASRVSPHEAQPRALALAERAIALDPSNGEGYAVRGLARMLYRHEWQASETDLQRAIGLEPGNIGGRTWLAMNLMFRGQSRAAIDVARRAVVLDPLSPTPRGILSNAYYFDGDYARALAVADSALAIEDRGGAREAAGLALIGLGRYEDAIEHFTRSGGPGRPPRRPGYLAYALARAGRTVEAKQVLDSLIAQAASGAAVADQIALTYTATGDVDAAVRWLNVAYEGREPGLLDLSANPMWSPLRNHAGFRALISRMGLPAT